MSESDDMSHENQWKRVYLLGGAATLMVLLGAVLDVVVGSYLGGNLSALPQTAVDRFAQFQSDPLLGLYNLDLLNTVNQIVLIPAYVALYAAQRQSSPAFSLLALVIFLVGTTVFVSTNTALPMLDLSERYAAAATESQKMLFAAAGEGLLARGTHGSLGVFIGFLLPNLAGLAMAYGMFTGKVFGKATALAGLIGSALIVLYLVLVTFVPAVRQMATAAALPGGLLLMAWMSLFAVRLFQLSRPRG